MKRTIISLSSSSSSEKENEEYDDDDDYEEISENATADDEEESNDEENEESVCNRVICFLKEGKDIECLSLKEYKAYLRYHGLRLFGSKAVCFQRIKDHWRIKDGNGESLHPASSFVINCTGDVCNGDVVLFTQRVYGRFDKLTRRGKLLGKRTVAGRVVNESYGSAKQQHTFTVEVLWSKGVRKLPPLFPLLVKGRNLYKLKTFRQCWNNEAERLKVLAEKHKRGAAARLMRAVKKSKKTFTATGHLNEVVSHQKCSRHRTPSQTIKTAEPGKRKHVYGHKKDTLQQYVKDNNHHWKVPPHRQLNLKRNIRSGFGSKSARRHLQHERLSADMDPIFHPYAYSYQNSDPSRIEFHDRTALFYYSSHEMGSTSTNAVGMTALRHQLVNHRYHTPHYHSNPTCNFGGRNLNHF